MREELRDPRHSSADIDRLEDFLLLVRRRVHEGRHQIGERAGGFDALDGRKQFAGRLRQELYGFDRLPPEMEETGLDLVGCRSRLRNPLGPRDEERPTGQIVEDSEPLLPLANEMIGSIGRRDVANDIGDRPHSMQVDRKGIGDLGVALHHDADRLLFLDRPLRRQHRTGTAERDRQHRRRKKHHAAHRAR